MNGEMIKRCAMAAALLAAAGCIILAVSFGKKEDAGDLRGEESPFLVSHLRTCYLKDPIGIDEEAPVFSWRMEGTERGICQSAYRIVIAQTEQELAQGQFFWDSGRVSGSESVDIAYRGDEDLAPKTRYYWQVTVWDENDRSSVSGETAYFETGLMGEEMQNALWIAAPEEQTAAEDGEAAAYTVCYDMSVTNTEVSFVFGAQAGRYGDMYLCGISNNAERATFSLRTMRQGRLTDTSVIAEADITACRRADDNTFAVQLRVAQGQLTVVINNMETGVYEIGDVPAAAVGCYMGRGSEGAYLDNLLVTDLSGNILYQDDFEDDDTVFSPYYVKIQNGRLKLDRGLILAAYPDHMGQAAPLFYREFALRDQEIESARIYMTALGSFDLLCNGQRVTDDYFAPGKMSYTDELAYMTYDVTAYLKRGEYNALGITLLHGYRGRAAGYPEVAPAQDDRNALKGMLEVRYRDGGIQTIVTDESFWCTLQGPVREDDIYHGEFYDATREEDGFGLPGFVKGGGRDLDTSIKMQCRGGSVFCFAA